MALDFFAGCVGGCGGILVGHPLDTIKVHLQTQDFRNPVYRGSFHCFRTILQKESVGGLYRGMSSPMAGVALINAILFGVYGNVQRRLSDPEAPSSHMLAGFTAGLVQSFVSSPMELAKTRLQVQRGDTYRSCVHCISQVARSEGTRGVYRGLGLTILRDSPAVGFYFLSYELISRSLGTGEAFSTMQVMLAGGLAGSISWIVTFPVDVLKSRLQVDGMEGPAKYSGALDCFRRSLKEEGLTFLTRGLTSTLVRAFVVNAATFAGVTWVFRLAGVGSTDDQTGYLVPSQSEELSDVKLYRPLPGQEVWRLWENWESKALNGLFHWRKLMVNNIEGSFYVDYQQKGLPSKLITDISQSESKSTDTSPERLVLELPSKEDDSDTESANDVLICTEQQEDIKATIPAGEINLSSVGKASLKEKYRTSEHDNG